MVLPPGFAGEVTRVFRCAGQECGLGQAPWGSREPVPVMGPRHTLQSTMTVNPNLS